MANVKWIKIAADIFDDEKILLIEQMPESESIIVIWFKLLCLAGKQNNSGVFTIGNEIAYTEEMFAAIFRRKLETVRLAFNIFEKFNMIQVLEGFVSIPNWGKYQNFDKLEQKTEYQRVYMNNYREKQRAIASSKSCKANSKANSKANVSSIDIDIEKDKEYIYSRDESAKIAKSTPSVAQSVTLSPSFNSQISETIAYLNKCTGSKFSDKTRETIKHLKARLTEGYSAADLKSVIDNRVKAWGADDKMREYLRPSTLFSPTNFENYLNDSKTEYQSTARDKAGQSAGYVSSPAPYNDDEYQRDQLITELRKKDTVFDSKFRRQRELTLLMAKGQALDNIGELEQLEKEINGRIEDETRKSS